MISQLLAKELGLALDINYPGAGARSIDGRTLTTYSFYRIQVQFTDCNLATSAPYKEDFLGADITGCDILLGLPWLRGLNPLINWETDEWEHRDLHRRSQDDLPAVELVEPDEFAAEVVGGERAYVAYIRYEDLSPAAIIGAL